MKKLTLTMLDTSGIQDYIFNSNRLQENIGASELVYRATTLWAFEKLPAPHNVKVNGIQWMINDGDIEKDSSSLNAEVIYAGGGNTMILFKDKDEAKKFTKRITTKVLKEAPGLTLVASHLEFDIDTVSLANARTKLRQQLAAHKQSRQPSVPLLGLGVSAVCQSTGLPAVCNDTGTVKIATQNETREIRLRLKGQENEPPRLISRETVAKLAWRDMATERLKKDFDDYQFPSDIDKLGRLEGDESYVAVVHADGNRMGKHLEEALQDTITLTDCKKALRTFSEKVNAAGLSAVKHVVELVAKAVAENRIPHEGHYLPLRPLVFGGDDVTLLCNGQIGVSLAAAYLEAFEKAFKEAPIIKGLEDVHGRAGIAIVKMHYPFARAYNLSEELAKSAKKFIKNETNGDCSALDWHYATGGLSGELDLIREREYSAKEGELNLRPVRIDPGDQKDSGRYWRGGLESVILKFKNDAYWSKRKNKVVGLRDHLRKGADAVKTYRTNFEIQLLPELASASARENGWQEKRCIYFDAVELFDQYLPLEKQEA
ncbi:MAG TPA: hypothetical protein VJ972_08885 [Anaerolineales bacterium]|nr:hypothetical protein [Anaerolineales bacterium]